MGMKSSSDKLTNLKKTHKKQVDSLSNRIQNVEKNFKYLGDSISVLKDSIQILQIRSKEKVNQKKKASLQQSAKRQ